MPIPEVFDIKIQILKDVKVILPAIVILCPFLIKNLLFLYANYKTGIKEKVLIKKGITYILSWYESFIAIFFVTETFTLFCLFITGNTKKIAMLDLLIWFIFAVFICFVTDWSSFFDGKNRFIKSEMFSKITNIVAYVCGIIIVSVTIGILALKTTDLSDVLKAENTKDFTTLIIFGILMLIFLLRDRAFHHIFEKSNNETLTDKNKNLLNKVISFNGCALIYSVVQFFFYVTDKNIATVYLAFVVLLSYIIKKLNTYKKKLNS